MRVVTFGEALFRLSTIKGERLSHAQTLNFCLGGTELNIAANLRSLGIPAEWVSCLPDGMTGELIREKVRQLDVDCSHSKTVSKGRAGWYLVETGSLPRPDVVFNRYASCLADVDSYELDWQKIFSQASVFHTSGVTAGLSASLTSEVENAMKKARSQNVLVSYDFNYRKNIWSIPEFIERQKSLLPLIDILFCAESDLELFFKKKVEDKNYAPIFDQSSLKYLIINQRSADESEYGISVITKDQVFPSRKYKIQNLDRIGVGDSMAAGFLAAFLKTQDLQEASEWGSAAGALKYSIQGDMALLKENEIKELLTSGARGIIR